MVDSSSLNKQSYEVETRVVQHHHSWFLDGGILYRGAWNVIGTSEISRAPSTFTPLETILFLFPRHEPEGCNVIQ